MDATMLARIQFGFSIGFHFLFPATTLGLTLFIMIYETLFLARKDKGYRQISDLLIKLLAVVYVMGIATGATMEFSFGTNWEGFSKFAGSVFGLPVAIEGITAFALEAAFLAVLLFGRKKVSPFFFWLSAFLVFFGSHLSGLWIISANSWMQTPTGYVMQHGKPVLTSFWPLLFNSGTWLRFAHTVVATWMAGAGVVAALAAWYALKKQHGDFSRRLLGPAAALFILLPLVQLELGHLSAVYVDRHQPAKSAAMEGVFHSGRNKPLIIFGIPDARNHTIHLPLGIPGLLSILLGWSPNTPVKGLNEFRLRDWPSVNVVFTTFHLMVVLGFISIGIGLIGAWLWRKKQWPGPRWFLIVLLINVFLPYIAVEMGWISAEIGRQPWMVYGLLRTRDAVSSGVSASQLIISLTGLVGLYTFLFIIFLISVFKIIQKGPAPLDHDTGEA